MEVKMLHTGIFIEIKEVFKGVFYVIVTFSIKLEWLGKANVIIFSFAGTQ